MSNDLISRHALFETLNNEKIPFNGDVNYFIMNAPVVSVRHTDEYKDLYDKYLTLAKVVNEQHPEIMKLLTDYKENMPRFNEEYNALLRRFRHLMKSKFIASFDAHDPKTHTYKRDIAEADKIAPLREGKWETVSLPQDGPRTFCTSCRKIVEVPPFTPYDFCPRCGAKMKLR